MPPHTASVAAAPPAAQPLRNVDLVRFVLALVVLLSHSANFLGVEAVGPDGFVSHPSAILSAARILLNGPAAVMVFFIVSGACIHAPRRGGRPLGVMEYCTRRGLRIAPPLLVAWALSALVMGDRIDRFPAWSLCCEAIYYLAYPLLLPLLGRAGFAPVFALSALASLAVCATPDLHDGQPWTYGAALTWVLYLPVWLSGVAVAEFAHHARRWPAGLRTGRAVGAAALGLALLGAASNWAQIHPGLPPYKASLLLFSVPAAAFVLLILSTDLSRSRICRLLDRQGAWSYSLYLVHTALTFLLMGMLCQAGVTRFTPSGSLLICALLVAYVLANAWGFHHVVERPSHLLARHLGRRVGAAEALTITSPALRLLPARDRPQAEAIP